MTTAMVARRPTELRKAHEDIMAWIARRSREIAEHRKQLQAELDKARTRKWGTASLCAALRRMAKHEEFLEKVKLALEAGYTVIPNLPLNLLAVRTDGRISRASDRERPTVGAKRLPAGNGEYVSPEPHFQSWTVPQEGSDGRTYEITMFQTTECAPVDVPLVLVERGLAEALHEAMRERLFDEIGVVEDQRQRDPVLVGRILHPKAGRWDRRGISFFLGWWFDTRDLDP